MISIRVRFGSGPWEVMDFASRAKADRFKRRMDESALWGCFEYEDVGGT